MIFRAIFWIGLVALLMPHEPDLGFGRPGASESVLPKAAAWAQDKLASGDAAELCGANAQTCAATATVLDDFRTATVRSLAAVKADIARNGRTHLHLGGS
jgi:hypothetical protein